MRWVSAGSDSGKIEEAIERTGDEILRSMDGDSIDLAVFFVSPHHSDKQTEIPRLIGEKIGPALQVGCTAGAVIGGGRELEQSPGFSLTAAHLPGVKLTPAAVGGKDLPDMDAPPGAWEKLLSSPREEKHHFLVLADPFSFSAPALLAGLDYAWPSGVKVGGLASGARGPGGNVLYLDDRVRSAGAIVLSFSGNIEIDAVVAQGCRPIGKTMQITGCRGKLLLAVDGVPPLQAVRELVPTLPEEDRSLVSDSLFLGIAMDELREDPGSGRFLIRNLIGMDPDSGALAVGETLRAGRTVRFHLRDSRSSSEDLDRELAKFAASGRAGEARGALLFSCLGRGIGLYGHRDHDTEAFVRHLGDIPLGGFFCNGEIGPVGGASHLHGFTSSFGIFRPKPGGTDS